MKQWTAINKNTRLPLMMIGLLGSLFLAFFSTSASANNQSSNLLRQSHFVPQPQQANFVHGTSISNSIKDSTENTANLADYSAEQMAQALTGVAVFPDGHQAQSHISADDLTNFKQTLKSITRYQQSMTYFDYLLNESQALTESVIPMVVIDSDNRQQINNTLTRPYWHIGRIDVGCTGTLIADKYVLTAGHCISDGDGQWYSNLNFTVAQNGSYKPWNSRNWIAAITTAGWYYDQDSNFDYGLIVLETAANGGWLGFGTFTGGQHQIAGYASEKTYASMWTDTGSVSAINNYRFCYQMDTSNGMSGSPVIDNNHYIRGIHTTGSSSKNCGTQITPEVYSTLHHWINTYP